MQGLHYRAIDEHGRVHLGYSTNKNHAELDALLHQRGLQPLPATGLQRIGNTLGIGPRLPQWPKSSASIFTLHLSQLLSAGVPLLTALEELIKQETQKSVRTALEQMRSRVDQGDALSDAMAACSGLFGPDYIATVRAGEASGELSRALRQQATNLQWQADLSERLKTVLAYPLFALVCLVVVFLFVLLYLVPAMTPLLSMSVAPVPAHTKWLLGLSELVRQSGILVLLILSMGCAVVYAFLLSESFVKTRLQSIILRGVYGQILTHFLLARYARSASLLYESGVEFTDAMQISQNLVGNTLLRNQLNAACQRILSGESISKAMQSQPALPRLFVRMISAGEHAGVMGVALNQCADQLHSTAQYSLARAERLIGPSLLCIMGSLLLWVALSVLGPIYSAVGQTGVLP